MPEKPVNKKRNQATYYSSCDITSYGKAYLVPKVGKRRMVSANACVNEFLWIEEDGNERVSAENFYDVYKRTKSRKKGIIHLNDKHGQVDVDCENINPLRRRLKVRNKKKGWEIVFEADRNVADAWYDFIFCSCNSQKWKDWFLQDLRYRGEKAFRMVSKRIERIKRGLEMILPKLEEYEMTDYKNSGKSNGKSFRSKVKSFFRKLADATYRLCDHIKPLIPALIPFNPAEIFQELFKLFESSWSHKKYVVKARKILLRLSTKLLSFFSLLMESSIRDQGGRLLEGLKFLDGIEANFGLLQKWCVRSRADKLRCKVFDREKVPKNVLKSLEEKEAELDKKIEEVEFQISNESGERKPKRKKRG